VGFDGVDVCRSGGVDPFNELTKLGLELGSCGRELGKGPRVATKHLK
jgi:hypothetical protein